MVTVKPHEVMAGAKICKKRKEPRSEGTKERRNQGEVRERFVLRKEKEKNRARCLTHLVNVSLPSSLIINRGPTSENSAGDSFDADGWEG